MCSSNKDLWHWNVKLIQYVGSELGSCFISQAEEVDLNAHLHGNWTVANAKSRLHQYLQQNRCSADFKYTTGGPDHNRFA